MKKGITKEQQLYINQLLDNRKNRKKPVSKEMDKERMLQHCQDDVIARNGMTYLEIEQMDKTFNNYKRYEKAS